MAKPKQPLGNDNDTIDALILNDKIEYRPQVPEKISRATLAELMQNLFAECIHMRDLSDAQKFSVLGVGGLGSVCQARVGTRNCAHKEVREVLRDNDQMKKLAREIIMQNRVSATAPKIIAADIAQWRFIMELFLDGTLSDIFSGRIHQNLSPQERFQLGSKIIYAVKGVSSKGIVHRDVKPDNFLLDRSMDRVVITDFGLAMPENEKPTERKGAIVGTPMYMPPEQLEANDEPITVRSDIHSLGGVLFQLLRDDYKSLIELVAFGRRPNDYLTALRERRGIDELIPQIARQYFWWMPNRRRLYNLLMDCYAPDPERRIDIDDLLTEWNALAKKT